MKARTTILCIAILLCIAAVAERNTRRVEITGGVLSSEIRAEFVNVPLAYEQLKSWLAGRGFRRVEISWEKATGNRPVNPMGEQTAPWVFLRESSGGQVLETWGIAEPTEARPYIGVYYHRFFNGRVWNWKERSRSSDAEAQEFWDFIQGEVAGEKLAKAKA